MWSQDFRAQGRVCSASLGPALQDPKASGHCTHIPPSSGTLGLSDLFLPVFVFANMKFILAKSKLAFFNENLVTMLNKQKMFSALEYSNCSYSVNYVITILKFLRNVLTLISPVHYCL